MTSIKQKLREWEEDEVYERHLSGEDEKEDEEVMEWPPNEKLEYYKRGGRDMI